MLLKKNAKEQKRFKNIYKKINDNYKKHLLMKFTFLWKAYKNTEKYKYIHKYILEIHMLLKKLFLYLENVDYI